MRRLLLLALSGLLAVTLAPTANATATAVRDWPWPQPVVPTPAHQESGTVRLGGVEVDLRAHTRQVVTVNHRSGHGARVSYWVKRKSRWKRTMTAVDGRIGYGGLVERKQREQGTGTTPLGTFGLPFAFGRHRDQKDFDLRYRKIRRGDYWVQDNASDHYNRYRNIARGGFRPRTSENLRSFGDQYEWAIVMDFNWNQVRHRGAGIFLHVNGDGATAGCVSAPRWFIRRLMKRLDADQGPVVAVGR